MPTPKSRYRLPKPSALSVIFALSVLLAGPAFAQDTDQRPAGAINAKPANETASAKDGSDWQIKPRWRLQYDIADIDGPAGLVGAGSFNAIRRARLGVDIKAPDGFFARIDAEFQDSPIVFVDAYAGWEKGHFSVTVGQQKAINPLDLNSSNLNTSFMERPAFYNAFNYGRGTGLLAAYERDDFGVLGGIFTDPLIMLNDVDKNSVSADFRSYWSPQIGEVRLHLAGSVHMRDLKDFASIPTRYRQRPFVRITDTRYIGTPGLFVEQETRYGLEAATTWRRLHAVAEVHWLKASRTQLSDPRFFGAYAEAGVFLTDDRRPLKTGAFGTVKPKKPLGSGGIGAVQVNVRYDFLDLNSAGITGGRQNGYLASLVWTPVEFLKFLINYARLEYSDATIAVAGSRNYTVDVVGMRTQISF
jgi:phosphate-selective porin OprO/OprP